MENLISVIRLPLENFIKSPNKNNLHKFKSTLKNVERSQVNILQSYILIPLVVEIKKLSERQETELIAELIKCITEIIKKISIKDINALKTILIATLHQIHNFETGRIRKESSEEIKIAVIDCISQALQQSTFDVLEEFYKSDHISIISKVTITCVDLIENEKYRLLRIAAILCLQSVFYVHDRADFNDYVLRCNVAELIFIFLPKITYTLHAIVIGDEKQGHILIARSIQTLGRFFSLIFYDYVKSDVEIHYNCNDFINLVNSSKSQNLNVISDDEILKMKVIKSKKMESNLFENKTRSPEWLGACSRKLKNTFSKMIILCANKSSEIRIEYAKFSATLALNCAKNLKENFAIFLETLITLSQDEELEIQKLCIETIKIMDSNSMKSELQNIFEKHLIHLPRIICRREESEQITEFLFLKGFLNIFPIEIYQQFFCIQDNLDKLIKCLISAYELQLTKNLLQEEYALRNIEENLCSGELNKFPNENFKNLSYNRAANILNDFIKALSRTIVMELIFDKLIAEITINSRINNECILILTIMLTGDNENNDPIKSKLLENFIIELLEEIHWHLAIQPDLPKKFPTNKKSEWFVDRTPGLYESAIEIRKSDLKNDENDIIDFVNVSDAQYNVLHVCLILEAIGKSALQLGENFKPFMFKCLHKILLKTNNSNFLIHKSGSFALNCLSKALNFSSIASLIEHYSDYISFHINCSLKNPCIIENKSAVDILAVVLRYSSPKLLPYLVNIIETILKQLAMQQNASANIAYLKVFDMFFFNVNKWSKSEMEHNSVAIINNESKLNKSDIHEKFIEILNRPFDAIDDLNMNENENELNESVNIGLENCEPDVSEISKELPKHIKIVLKILKEILKCVSSKNQLERVISLECYMNGLPILNSYENELLPLIHIFWYPYIERFKDDDTIVLNRCFSLLKILAVCAKDFLLQRTLKDIIPFLNKFLHTSSLNSMQNINTTQTQEFKLQCILLSNYGYLIRELEIMNQHLDDILNAIILYLSNKQPELLQQNAVNFFKTIMDYNLPVIYIKLKYFGEDIEYIKNIDKIMGLSTYVHK